jgi:hypothetical protein
MRPFGRKPVDPTENKQLDPKGRVAPWGRPLTKADGRLYDLRDSGYTGWVDQHGNRVSDEDARNR